MRQRQREAARESMAAWLAHPQELGRTPSKIRHAGEFERHGMRYYMFKYKKSMLDFTWLLGVCGGYENDDDLEHSGHVFSEMEPYDPATAEEKSIAMVEMIREHWMWEAERARAQTEGEEEEGEGEGSFLSFVLLDSADWDADRFRADLKTAWGISVPDEAGSGGTEDGEDDGLPRLVWEVDGMLASVALIDAPIPDGEAERNAATNTMWPEGPEAVKSHTAQVLVAVLPHDGNPVEAGTLMVKLVDACLMRRSAVGVYASGTVFEPGFYRESAAVMRDGDLPYLNWIHFGVVRTERGFSLYTYGMRAFGKDEMEILDSSEDPNEIRNFLFNVAAYVISQDATLREGETLGYTADEKLPVTRSKGVHLDGMTLKIGLRPVKGHSSGGKGNPW